MPPIELNLRFTAAFTQPVILALEPAATAEVWGGIYQAANELVDTLAGRLGRIYFLANPNSYPVTLPRDVREALPAWYSANRGRVSCLGPILEVLEQESFKGRIVVIASQMPVDLEDWMETQLFTQIVLLWTGMAPFPIETEQVDSRHGAKAALAAIDDPPRRLDISGPGFAPLVYDLREGGTAEVVYDRADGFHLTIEPAGARLDLHLTAVGTEAAVLMIERARGSREPVSAETEAPWSSDPPWQPLQPEVKAMVAAGIARKTFTCTQCGEEHPYDCLRCPQGGPILRGVPLNTCVLLTGERYLALSDRYAYPLDGNTRLLTREGLIFAWRGVFWQNPQPLQPYAQLGDGIYGLFHKI